MSSVLNVQNLSLALNLILGLATVYLQRAKGKLGQIGMVIKETVDVFIKTEAVLTSIQVSLEDNNVSPEEIALIKDEISRVQEEISQARKAIEELVSP